MHSYVFRGLLKPWTIAAHACTCSHRLCFQLYTRHWRENDLLHERAGNFVRFLHLMTSIARTSLLIHSTDWSLTNFSTRFPYKFPSSLTRNLTEMLIWKENDSVKYGDFPDQSQSFRFFARALAPKQTTLSLDWSGRGLSRKPFIPAVRVLCKLHSYKWFLSPLM